MHTTNRCVVLSLSSVLVLTMLAMSTLWVSGCGPVPAAPPAVLSPSPTTPLAAAPTPTPVPAGPVRGGTLTLAFTEDPNSLDAILGYNLAAWQSLMNLYRGLMIYEGDRAVPDMADGWPEISPDGLVYTFKIKPGIKFHNGREVEAADFKYSLERVLDPDWAS